MLSNNVFPIGKLPGFRYDADTSKSVSIETLRKNRPANKRAQYSPFDGMGLGAIWIVEFRPIWRHQRSLKVSDAIFQIKIHTYDVVANMLQQGQGQAGWLWWQCQQSGRSRS